LSFLRLILTCPTSTFVIPTPEQSEASGNRPFRALGTNATHLNPRRTINFAFSRTKSRRTGIGWPASSRRDA
jgi:hypothetical protein